jgi:hypothetical protein
MDDLRYLIADKIFIPEKVFPWGRPADIWFRYADVVRGLIDRYKLKPFQGAQMPRALGAAAATKAQLAIPHRIPFPGGLRVAHLHFKDDIYLLNDEHWKAFSGQVMKEFKSRLAKVNAVSFDEVLAISHAVDPLV